MERTYYIMPPDLHDTLVSSAFRHRGYNADEAAAAARLCGEAVRHGVRTHNAVKALDVEGRLGSRIGGCRPNAAIEKLPSRFKAAQKWNANRKLGMAVAYEAMDACMAMADEYGVGVVSVDNAFHYLWGGGYAIYAADKGYIAYTCCTAALSSVVPFGGKSPTIGTNPHSWAFPTRSIIGYPVCIDWATSTVAMGRVQQYAREGKSIPPDWGVDQNGNATTDPKQVKALLPFGGHKGYGLCLLDELMAAFIGGSLPTIRSRWSLGAPDEKHTSSLFFQCIHPDAISGDDFACGRSQMENVAAVLADIRGHGNEQCMLPGQPEAEAAALSDRLGGLLFTPAEVDAFTAVASEAGIAFERAELKKVEL